MATSRFLGWERTTSMAGVCTSVWVSFTWVKTGVSSMRSRMYSPTATTTMLSKNGMRQPQAKN
jgi:hypothetical protein